MNALEQLLRSYRAQLPKLEDHPEFNDLDRVARKVARVDEQELVLDHVSNCRECADIILELRRENPGVQSLENPSSRPFWSRPAFPYALAAIFLLALLFPLNPLHFQPKDKIDPIDYVATLAPSTDAVRTEGRVQILPWNQDLVLQLATTQIYPNYELRALFIRESSEKPRIVIDLTQQDNRIIAMHIDSKTLPKGNFSIKTQYFKDKKWHDMDTYVFRIDEP